MFRLTLSFAISLVSVAWASAGYVLVDNLEDLTLGAISGQQDWSASSGVEVATDPADLLNQVLAVASQNAIVRKPMPIEQGTVRMAFLRFRFESQLSVSCGLSHLQSPTEFSDFGPEMNLTNSKPDLRTANGDTPGVYDTLTTLAAGQWHNLWLQIDAAADTTRVWLNSDPGESATGDDLLDNDDGLDLFGFRTSSSSDLKRFYIKAGSGGSGDFGPLLIDDIYLETTAALNLINPTNPLPGDYNLDGEVDAADYTVWRDEAMSAEAYDVWRSNYGEPTLGLTTSATPEPAACLLLTGLAPLWLSAWLLRSDSARRP